MKEHSGGQAEATQQQKRMTDEMIVTSAFFGLSLSVSKLHPVVGLFGFVLMVIGFGRYRVVNHPNTERARDVLYATDPFILILPALISFIFAAGLVDLLLPEQQLTIKIGAFAIICLIGSIIVISIERLMVGQYFAWWAERAADNIEPDGDGFWQYVAHFCNKFSKAELSTEERRQYRSRQRRTPGPFQIPWKDQEPPSPSWSWIITVLKWLLSSGRIFTVLVGIILFRWSGFETSFALAVTLVVYVAAASLSDQLRYWYLYWAMKGERSLYSPDKKSPRNALIEFLRSYWITALAGILIVWFTF